jgi:fatty-acid desaturase
LRGFRPEAGRHDSSRFALLEIRLGPGSPLVNNVLVAIITSGEGWHDNHHADPGSASNQRRWCEIDLTYRLLRLLVLPGPAWDVQLPKRAATAV